MIEQVTINASQAADDYTDEDYWNIYCELRNYDPQSRKYGLTATQLIDRLRSKFDRAMWSNYQYSYERSLSDPSERIRLTRPMKSELRAAINVAPLVPTVAEAVGAADPDSEVLKIGPGTAQHVIMIGEQCPGILIRFYEGDIRARPLGATSGATQGRRRLVRPVASKEQEAARMALGLPWKRIIDAGLESLSAAQVGAGVQP